MGRFANVQKLAEGAYGVVSRAQDTQTGDQEVVLKHYKGHDEDGVSWDCLRELAALRTCAGHPNVLQLREITSLAGVPGVVAVLEPMKCDLYRHYVHLEEAGTPLLQAERLRIMAEVASGLAHLHDRGHMHRDLKPGNILVGFSGQVKLADFGLARVYTPGRSYTIGMCTLWYRAPELLLGTAQYGLSVDLWSLGCIHAEIARGAPLLPGADADHQMLLICSAFGQPSPKTWPGVDRLPNFHQAQFASLPPKPSLAELCLQREVGPREADLMTGLLALDPAKRLSAQAAAVLARTQDPTAATKRKRQTPFPPGAGRAKLPRSGP